MTRQTLLLNGIQNEKLPLHSSFVNWRLVIRSRPNLYDSDRISLQKMKTFQVIIIGGLPHFVVGQRNARACIYVFS